MSAGAETEPHFVEGSAWLCRGGDRSGRGSTATATGNARAVRRKEIWLAYPSKSFTGGHPALAAIVWMLTAQYFVAQLVAALAWPSGYDWIHNSVSDLGVSTCGPDGSDTMCSPLSVFFNLSLIAVGVAIVLGAVLVHGCLRGGWPCFCAFGCLATAGVGTIVLGMFPSDTIDFVHHVGVILAIFGATAGLLILGIAPVTLSEKIRWYTVGTGIVSLVGIVLVGLYFIYGVGFKGVAERVASYPVTLWFTVFGLYLSRRGTSETDLLFERVNAG